MAAAGGEGPVCQAAQTWTLSGGQGEAIQGFQVTCLDWHFKRSRWWQVGGWAEGGKIVDETNPETWMDDKTRYKARVSKGWRQEDKFWTL